MFLASFILKYLAQINWSYEYFSISKIINQFLNTVDPGYNQRQWNAIGVSYNRTFLYPGFKRNEIASRGQDTHWL